jgi:phosphohistidine phosphatase
MLRLTLIRHAKTEPAHSGQEDWDRALEARGQHDAAEMGRRLKGRHLKPEKMLVSPAVRALTTAQTMARELGMSRGKLVLDERLYLASSKDMLKVIQELGETAAHLALVGHNPGITDFADQLASERSMENMPTGGVFTLEFDIAHWSDLAFGTGVNADFDYPTKSC